jgi:general stress protein 26
MTKEAEIESKFWKALRADMTLMLGLNGVDEDHAQPMTAQFDGDGQPGPIYFFTAKDAHLARALEQQHEAFATFASKDHELFASLHGQLRLDNDREVIDRLWNRFVAAWYPGGKDDPNLQLLRLDPEHGRIWLNENNVFAGIKLLLGRDPKKDYQDKTAEVRLHH